MTADALIEKVAEALWDSEGYGFVHSWEALMPETRERHLVQARAALSAIEANGYRVVPVEPTQEMAEKARNAIYDSAPSTIRARSVYAAMIAAAPKLTEPKE